MKYQDLIGIHYFDERYDFSALDFECAKIAKWSYKNYVILSLLK